MGESAFVFKAESGVLGWYGQASPLVADATL